MSLTSGSRIGPYEVIGALGAGGMGEVYRARDGRLDRQVAIKVLPAGVATDPDRRARFEREAKAIAALSHPNILAIHDIGESAGTHGDAPGSPRPFLYAVTELLEGETLRDRLTTQGALPVRKAIDIAVQIARGLAAAHDRGIVHRDLKPENIFVRMDGQVKILDFGLARHAAPASSGSGATETAAVTDPGTVMGTIGYMAPEQVRGGAVDARTDLFALGAVIHEMVSGQRAFRRETAAETMTAILREDPSELSTARPDISPALERIVRHCLEKNPAERFQTARDVAFALEAFSGTAISSTTMATLPKPRRSWRTAAVVALFTIAGAAAGYAVNARLASTSSPDLTFDTRTWDSQWITNARFGPDGQTIVYSAATSGNVPDLFVARPGTSITQSLGQRRTHLLSVSKTGELAVLTDVKFIGHRLFTGTLARMTMDGGARPLMEQVREADWSPDGSSLAVVRDLGTKDRLEYPAGKMLYEANGYLSDPRVSPDGSRVAFFEHPFRYDDRGRLKLVDRNGKVTTHSDEFWGAEGLAWSPDGGSILMSAAGAAASGYYPRIVNIDGPPNERSAFPSIVPVEMMDVAADGRVLVNQIDNRLSMRVLLPGETSEREFPWLDLPQATDMSTDGLTLLFTDEGQSAGLNYAAALRKTDGSPAVRLGEGAAVALSPDAKWAISFVPSPNPGRFLLYPTGPGQTVPLDLAPVKVARSSDMDWLANGQIFFCGTESGTQHRCYRKDISGGAPVPLTPAGVTRAWSARDGRTVLASMENHQWQVFDGSGGPGRPVPGDHAGDLVLGWSKDGRSVFARSSTEVPARIDRIDLATGARTHVREIMPPDRAGVMHVHIGRMVNDGQHYSYDYWRQVTKAIVVTGVPMH
jgi:serine/threonine protein kinase